MEVYLFGTGAYVQLALVRVSSAVAATHGLLGDHTFLWTHTPAGLFVTDSTERAVRAGLICGREEES